MLQIKVVKSQFGTKKAVGMHVYLPHGEELGGSKDCHFQNIKMYENGKVNSL